MPPSRELSIPNKRKTKLSVPFSNKMYDYSEIFGSQVYEERNIKYNFNIAGRSVRTKDQMNWLKTTIINWLMNSGGKQPLYDDNFPGIYFLAEVEGDVSFMENWNFGFLEVTFTAYPFMISTQPEGHDVWDEFNFIYGLCQDTRFDVPPSGTFYKELAIGSQATIGAWATTTAGGPGGNLTSYVGASFKVLAKQNLNPPLGYSSRTYTLEGVDGPVYEQDIIQSCNRYLEITLVNSGTASVYPEITMTNTHTVPKLSVENVSTGMVYNFIGERPDNYLFQLKSGENKLRVYDGLEARHTIDFKYYRELI